MDITVITMAITTAVSAGVISGLTEASKTAVSEAYKNFKNLIIKKFGAKSDLVLAIEQLEAKPESADRKEILQKELTTAGAEWDNEIIAAAKHILTLVYPQQAKLSKFPIQNNALVQGQNIGNFNTNTQYFGELPKE